ncbi:MAG: rod-binding protein [Planctomycetota bacterium]|jgi:Rod binding domain-containing protein
MQIGNHDSGSGFGGLTRYDEARTRADGMNLEGQDALRARLENGDVDTVAREFESLFASMLIKEMRKTLDDGLFGKGPGADTYSGWFDQHVGASLADTGALDLAGMLRTGLPKGEGADTTSEAAAPVERTLEEWEDQR